MIFSFIHPFIYSKKDKSVLLVNNLYSKIKNMSQKLTLDDLKESTTGVLGTIANCLMVYLGGLF